MSNYQTLPQELINQLKTEYVSIGQQIKNVFHLHSNEDSYNVEYKYEGYHTHDLKCDPNGENTYFTLTDKLTGKKTNVTELSELVQGGIYSHEALVMIWTELIKLTAIEHALNSALKELGQQTDVYYERELFVQKHSISRMFYQTNSL
jgi:predicted amino acid-binding ACT domain protein